MSCMTCKFFKDISLLVLLCFDFDFDFVIYNALFLYEVLNLNLF